MKITIDKAYVTLVSSQDYLDGALMLQESLRRVKSKYPLVIVLTQDLYNLNNVRKLKKYNSVYEIVPRLEYSKLVQQNATVKKVLNTASKIQIFKLGWYEKLVYLDADCFILENVDELFDWPDGSKINEPGDKIGLTGCMVFQPREHPYDYYKLLVEQVIAYDGNLIGNLWTQCRYPSPFCIPVKYCQSNWDKPCKIFHFNADIKPWQKGYIKENFKYERLYLQQYTELFEK